MEYLPGNSRIQFGMLFLLGALSAFIFTRLIGMSYGNVIVLGPILYLSFVFAFGGLMAVTIGIGEEVIDAYRRRRWPSLLAVSLCASAISGALLIWLNWAPHLWRASEHPNSVWSDDVQVVSYGWPCTIRSITTGANDVNHRPWSRTDSGVFGTGGWWINIAPVVVFGYLLVGLWNGTNARGSWVTDFVVQPYRQADVSLREACSTFVARHPWVHQIRRITILISMGLILGAGLLFCYYRLAVVDEVTYWQGGMARR